MRLPGVVTGFPCALVLGWCYLAQLINYYITEQYTLRYTGGMVPDVGQILIKEKGVFTNVISPSTKAKLRLLFEVAPLGLLIEQAGGFSSDGFKSVLDIPIENTDVRTQVRNPWQPFCCALGGQHHSEPWLSAC